MLGFWALELARFDLRLSVFSRWCLAVFLSKSYTVNKAKILADTKEKVLRISGHTPSFAHDHLPKVIALYMAYRLTGVFACCFQLWLLRNRTSQKTFLSLYRLGKFSYVSPGFEILFHTPESLSEQTVALLTRSACNCEAIRIFAHDRPLTKYIRYLG